jgi:hypothetical protein
MVGTGNAAKEDLGLTDVEWIEWPEPPALPGDHSLGDAGRAAPCMLTTEC